MAVCYSREIGLALDANLALMMKRRAHKLAFVLEGETHRLALMLKYEGSQACVCVEMRSYISLRFDVKTRP